MDERGDGLIKGAGIISALTLLSRALGLVRDCICAAFFGAGMVWDAFSFAFRIPNLFRRLFGEGALSAAFVPAFTEHLELREKEEAWRLAGRVAGALLLVLVALLIIGESAVLAIWRRPGLSPRWRLALGLTAVMLPYMVFICLTALAGAALNSLRHFAAPAFAPVVLNVCWIVAVAAVAPLVSSDPQVRIFVVACAILAAGVLQLGLQVAVLAGKGFRWRISFTIRHPEVRRMGAVMAPVALGMAAFQLNVLLDGVIAISLAGPPDVPTFDVFGATIRYPMQLGANSVLYYGSRLMQVPLGVFGIAIATAAFPLLSASAARKDWPAFSESLMRGLATVLFVGIPAGVGLMLLRYPAVEALFERGAFTSAMTARTAPVLFAYSTAIWAYCAAHVLTRAFYALKRPGTPAKVAACMVALNLALNLTLVWRLQEAGMAAATAICAVVQVGVLYRLLGRRLRLAGQGRLLTVAWKTALSTALMALACWGTLRLLPGAAPDGAIGIKLLRLVLPAGAGLAAFLAAAAALRTEELAALLRQLRRDKRAQAG